MIIMDIQLGAVIEITGLSHSTNYASIHASVEFCGSGVHGPSAAIVSDMSHYGREERPFAQLMGHRKTSPLNMENELVTEDIKRYAYDDHDDFI